MVTSKYTEPTNGRLDPVPSLFLPHERFVSSYYFYRTRAIRFIKLKAWTRVRLFHIFNYVNAKSVNPVFINNTKRTFSWQIEERIFGVPVTSRGAFVVRVSRRNGVFMICSIPPPSVAGTRRVRVNDGTADTDFVRRDRRGSNERKLIRHYARTTLRIQLRTVLPTRRVSCFT